MPETAFVNVTAEGRARLGRARCRGTYGVTLAETIYRHGLNDFAALRVVGVPSPWGTPSPR